MDDVTLWVGGYPATEIAPHTPPTWETVADGGTAEISWSFALTPRSQHPALRPGSMAVVKVGGMPVARAPMVDPDRTSWDCWAVGDHSDRFLALDSSGNVTRNLGVAIDQAIARGWRVANPVGHGTGYTVPGDSTEPQSIGSLLTEAAQGQRWGVDPLGNIYVRSDPTTPWWHATPDSAVFGTTDEGTITHVVGVYFDGTNNLKTIRPALGSVVQHRAEEPIDLTDRGVLSLGQANAILDGALELAGQIGFTNGMTLTSEQITTLGGSSAFLPSIRAGVMMRAHGLISARANVQTPVLDFVIGKTRYTAGEDSIYIEPTRTAPRNLADVIASGWR
ncbi:hypothetical protein EUA06_11175 [Nocardioides glacieisoli]|uniref:Uncharacterized protein n=1 Tax=Nocardioides glacieisoli TaxID=1168730 RepID=A0A4Q2RPH8_9ACTN|nr:hypothetical protein [Nocardioides glacieisoli]RYB90830.1 hypothetical protein EUA06_11175 [Nocardioides glacieisoli]